MEITSVALPFGGDLRALQGTVAILKFFRALGDRVNHLAAFRPRRTRQTFGFLHAAALQKHFAEFVAKETNTQYNESLHFDDVLARPPLNVRIFHRNFGARNPTKDHHGNASPAFNLPRFFPPESLFKDPSLRTLVFVSATT